MKRFRIRPAQPRLRGLLAVGAAAVVAAGISVAAGTVATAQTMDPDPDTYYQLISRSSGKAIDVAGGSTATGAEVVQRTPQDGPSQQFRFVPSGGGYFRIMSRDSGLVLDVWNWNASGGADIRMWTDLNGTNQQFALRESSDGYVRLANRFSDLVLDVWQWSTQDGGRITQWTDLNGVNQQWQLVPVDDNGGPGNGGPGDEVDCDGQPGGGGPVDPLPVSGNISAHDPDMIRTPSGYVVFSTHNGVETRVSQNLTQWTRTAAAIPGGATWAGEYNGGNPNVIWAPDISFHNGTYWLYYSVSTWGSNRSAIGLATSTTGQPGSFVDRGMVFESAPGDNYNAIDPSLLVDTGGGWWLTFGSFWSGIKLIRIDPHTGLRSSQDLTVYSLASRPDTQIEGPSIAYRCGSYYLFVSWGQCCQGVNSTYQIRVGRADSPTGPYLDRNGVNMLAGGGSQVLGGHGRVVGPGAGNILADDNGDLLVYHYYDGLANGAVRLGLNRVSWAGGWPAVVP